MPFDAGTAKGALALDTSGFTSALDVAKKGLGSFVAGAAKIAAGIGLANIAGKALEAASGLFGLVGALKAGSAEAAEDERALVSLTNILRTKAVPNFQKVAAEADSLATQLQRTTGVADTAILGIVQRLTQLGVSSKSLESATQTVLDFSAAFGIDATRAAQMFGMSLQGNAGRLARFLPELKKLTKAQLEAGGAFTIAAKAAQGQAEVLGDTFTGRIDRLKTSFQDFLGVFGKGFNAAFGPLATEIQEVVDNLTDRLSSGEAFEQIKTTAQAAATAIKGVFLSAIEQLPTVVGAIISLAQAFISVVDGALAAKQAFTFGEADKAIQDIRDNLAKMGENLVAAGAKVEVISKNVKDTIDPAKSLADNAEAVAKAFGFAAVNVDKTAGATRRAEVAVASAKNKAQSLVDIWTKTNDKVQATAASVSNVTAETRDAELAASDLADGWGEVAAAATVAADKSDLAARFAAAGADSFGRRSGGSSAIDFSDPFRAAGQASAANQRLQDISGGGQSAFAGRTTINAARAFTQGVNTRAQAEIDHFIADFTAQILGELNSAGVFDLSERSRIVRERLAEARRFGTIPVIQGAL